MDLSGIFKNLKLDVWYKAFVYIGGIVLVLSFFFEAKGITNPQLQKLAGGFFLLGIGEWKNHKIYSWFRPPNVYARLPGAKITQPRREPDLFGNLLILTGATLLILVIISIINSPV